MGVLRNRWAARGGWREFVTLAFPLVLSTGAWAVQQFIDRVFLSWYSPEAIAAAVPASLLNFTVTCFFIGTAAYAGTFVAQYFGAARLDRIGPAVWQGIYVSALGGLLVLAMLPFAENIFALIGHAPELQPLEIGYFRVLCLGGFPVIGSAAVSGFFAGRGRAWPVMYVNIAAMFVNIGLNWLLIFGNWGFPELGIEGAGWATVISAFFGFLVFMALMVIPADNRRFGVLRGWRFDPGLFFRMMRYGIPNGAEFFMDLAGFTMFVLLVGRLGVVNLAATNIALNINMIAFMPMLGSGMAISILVGQYIGSNRPDLAEKSTWSGFHLTFFYMIVVASAYVFVPGVFIAPFTAHAETGRYDEIFALTVVLLRFVAVYSLFDAAGIIFASAIKGAGDTRFVMIALALLSAFVLVLPTYLAVSVFEWSLVACWAFVAAYAMMLGLVFLIRFRGGKWKTMSIIERSPARPIVV